MCDLWPKIALHSSRVVSLLAFLFLLIKSECVDLRQESSSDNGPFQAAGARYYD